MPHAPDKIIINTLGGGGMDAAINAQYAVAQHLGGEILENGWEKETTALRDELAAQCDKHHDAEMAYYQFLRAFNAKLAAFIDGHA